MGQAEVRSSKLKSQTYSTNESENELHTTGLDRRNEDITEIIKTFRTFFPEVFRNERFERMRKEDNVVTICISTYEELSHIEPCGNGNALRGPELQRPLPIHLCITALQYRR